MKLKNFLYSLILLPMVGFGQTLPPDPDPNCQIINREGMLQTNGNSTLLYISGYGTQDIQCQGINALIHPGGSLSPGEYAFGAFDADLILNTTVAETDFSFDLANTLVDLPINGEVKFAELHGQSGRKAELRLKKINDPQGPSVTGIVGVSSGTSWQLTVRWYASVQVMYTEDTFIFDADEVVNYNYVYADSRRAEPVELITFGRNLISFNPYVNQDIGVTATIGGGSNELDTYRLGLIDTSVTIPENNGIVFEINWSPYQTH